MDNLYGDFSRPSWRPKGFRHQTQHWAKRGQLGMSYKTRVSGLRKKGDLTSYKRTVEATDSGQGGAGPHLWEQGGSQAGQSLEIL